MLYIQVSKGFYNWKDVIFAFSKHEKSQCHLEKVDAIITLPATTMLIGTHLNRQHAIEVRKYTTEKFVLHKLARQGLPLRGQDDDSDSNILFSF